MNYKNKDIKFIPAKIERFVEKICLVDTDSWQTIDLFSLNNFILYPNKPKRIQFSYTKCDNFLSKFKSNSLRLDEDLKKSGICQYVPCLKKISNIYYIFLVNSSSKNIKIKKGQKIGQVQIYLDNALKNKTIIYNSSSYSFTSKDSSEISKENDNQLIFQKMSNKCDDKNDDSQNVIKKKYSKNNIDEESGANKTKKNKKIPKIFEENISIISQDSADEINNSVSKTKNSLKEKENNNYIKNESHSEIISVKKNITTLKNKYKQNKIMKYKHSLNFKENNSISDISKLEESILDYDFEENYLKKYSQNSLLGRKTELKSDIEILSKRYGEKSKDSYLKIKNLVNSLYNCKGGKKNKIKAKNIEKSLQELIILKKEENRFMKNAFFKIWKKVDNL